MSTQEAHSAAAPGGGAGGQPEIDQQAAYEAQQAAYEAELSRITSADMALQAAVSLLNIGARRLGLVGGGAGGDSNPAQGAPERDLEQVRDAIDAVRGLMPVIERRASQEARPLRDALSQLQMAYARETPAAPAPSDTANASGGAPAPPQQPQREPQQPTAQPQQPAAQPGGAQHDPGPAESSGRLWVPGR